jgi:hypothetical protein
MCINEGAVLSLPPLLSLALEPLYIGHAHKIRSGLCPPLDLPYDFAYTFLESLRALLGSINTLAKF